MDMQAKYAKALERAHDEGLQITLLESWGAHVTNPAHDGYYTVRFSEYAMTCNCKAGQEGLYCKHRALVREARLMRDAEAEAEAKAEMANQAHERWAEQRNEQVLTNSLWTTDQAAQYAAQEPLSGFSMEDLGYNPDGTDRLAAAEAAREERIIQALEHSEPSEPERMTVCDRTFREAYAAQCMAADEAAREDEESIEAIDARLLRYAIG